MAEETLSIAETASFQENLPKYINLRSWVLWYPDLFCDLIKPTHGGINLHMDQRLLLRCATRFWSVYGCFPRGWGKTFDEVLSEFIIAICYPNIQLSISAQTRQNSAGMLKDKCHEIVRAFPMFENEILKKHFHKDDAAIVFKNGARIDNLANSQNSKGQRRHRLVMEESALMNASTFEDALQPIVEVSRYTVGKLAIVNPEELNQAISFYTTPGWKGSDEYTRNIKMIRDMVDLKGKMVLGSNWMLACWYGRGSTKPQIFEKQRTMSSIAFSQNYGGQWTGSSNDALVNINRLMDCRVLEEPLWEYDDSGDEFYMGVDVARSEKEINNQSSAVIIRVKRNPVSGRILYTDVVNVCNISNTLNFTEQACILKKMASRYRVKKVILDGNGLGTGLVDMLLRNSVDPMTKEPLGCWDTINTDAKPESDNADRILYDFKAQSAQSEVLSVFIDMVDSKRLRLLEKRQENDFTLKDREDFERKILPFIQTDLLFEEISNLKLKVTGRGGLTVEQVVRKLNKDRFSALAYVVWYVCKFENVTAKKRSSESISSLFQFRAPKIK